MNVGGRATFGVKQGKFYYECTVTDEGLARVGWSTRSANRNLGTCKVFWMGASLLYSC